MLQRLHYVQMVFFADSANCIFLFLSVCVCVGFETVWILRCTDSSYSSRLMWKRTFGRNYFNKFTSFFYARAHARREQQRIQHCFWSRVAIVLRSFTLCWFNEFALCILWFLLKKLANDRNSFRTKVFAPIFFRSLLLLWLLCIEYELGSKERNILKL